MDRYEELARQATWVASKVSSDVHGVDTMVGHLAEGRFKIGAGDTAVMLEGMITPGKPLPGMVPVVTDNHLLLHDNTIYGDHGSRKWKEAYNHYVSLTKLGCIILAGTVEKFSSWAKSKACRDEVAGVPDGRLFALIDGYIVAVSAQADTASPTVANGKGSVVWADGGYYVGEIKDGLKHGEGTLTLADGVTYAGQWKDDKQHGQGTFTSADGDEYVGQWKDGKQHGLGKATLADGEVTHDGEWENGEAKE